MSDLAKEHTSDMCSASQTTLVWPHEANTKVGIY